jgi:transcriptional regulator with XRE-family HTH domain
MEHKIHEGRNVKRFREMLGIKQESLAYALGEEWTQKKVSMLEAKESLDAAVLHRISEVLKIPVEAFRNFDEEQAINVISNTFTNSDQAVGLIVNNTNPVDKIIQLHEEKITLYERMLSEKQQMMETLQKLLEKA